MTTTVNKIDPKIVRYSDWTLPELKEEARQRGIKGYSGKTKAKLLDMIRADVNGSSQPTSPLVVVQAQVSPDIQKMTIGQLKEAIKAKNGTGYSGLRKAELQQLLAKLSQ